MSAKKTNSNVFRTALPVVAAFVVFAAMLITIVACVIRVQPPEPDPPTTQPGLRIDLHAVQDTRVTWYLWDRFTFYVMPPGTVYVGPEGERVRLTEDMLPYTLRGAAAPERLAGR